MLPMAECVGLSGTRAEEWLSARENGTGKSPFPSRLRGAHVLVEKIHWALQALQTKPLHVAAHMTWLVQTLSHPVDVFMKNSNTSFARRPTVR